MITVDLSSLVENSPLAISDNVFVVRISSGIIATQRRCPHSGADLASGYVKDGTLRCAWHNLPIDLKDGSSPCPNIPCLELYAVRRVGVEGCESEVDVPEDS